MTIGKKRKNCIIKKTMELSILCDVKACIIISNADGKFETWPENRTEVEGAIGAYFKAMKEGSRFRKSKGQKSNVTAELSTGTRTENTGGVVGEGALKKVFGDLDDGFLDGLSMDSRKSFLMAMESKIKKIDKRREFLKNGGLQGNEQKLFEEILPKSPLSFPYGDWGGNIFEIFPEIYEPLPTDFEAENIGDIYETSSSPLANFLNDSVNPDAGITVGGNQWIPPLDDVSFDWTTHEMILN